MDVAQKQRVLDLFQKVIDLHSQQAAMRGVLRWSAIGQQIDWVKAFREQLDLIKSMPPTVVYEDIKNKLNSSNLEYPEAVLLLIELAERPIPA